MIGTHFSCKIDKELIRKITQAGCQKGVHMALDHLASVSKDQVPLDQGALKDSCAVDVADDGQSGTVSYNTPYAVVQHENTWYNHQRGRKGKYLEDPVNDSGVQKDIIELVRRGMADEMR